METPTRSACRASPRVVLGLVGTVLAMNVSPHRQLARDRQQADQRVQRSAVRHLSAGDVQPRARRARRCSPAALAGTCGQLLRRLPHVDQLSVAVGVRSGARRPSLTARHGRAHRGRLAGAATRRDTALTLTVDTRSCDEVGSPHVPEGRRRRRGRRRGRWIGGAISITARAREIYVRLMRPRVDPRDCRPARDGGALQRHPAAEPVAAVPPRSLERETRVSALSRRSRRPSFRSTSDASCSSTTF